MTSMLSQQFTWALPLRLLSLLLFNFILQLSIESKSSCSSISFLAKALRIEGEGGKDGRDAGMPARSSHNSSLYEDSLYEDSLYEDSLALESILIEDVMFHMKEVITSTVIRTDTDDCDKEHQGQTVRQSAGPLSSPGLKRVDGRFCDWRHLLHMVDPIHKMEPPKDWDKCVRVLRIAHQNNMSVQKGRLAASLINKLRDTDDEAVKASRVLQLLDLAQQLGISELADAARTRTDAAGTRIDAAGTRTDAAGTRTL